MTFLHDSPHFGDLLNLVTEDLAIRGVELAPSLVEKDYWITHVLWALQNAGLEVSFKGGTSLAKAFGIIKRFSEDLDLRIAKGSANLPSVGNWKSDGKTATAERWAFFKALASLSLPSVKLELDEASLGQEAKGAVILVDYPGAFKAGLPPSASPTIKLELGEARIRPSLRRPISSWVHERMGREAVAGRFQANQVLALACVHPMVTLVEKLDAICRRFIRADLEAKTFVRHYEDAVHIIRSLDALPPMGDFERIENLFLDLLRLNQIRGLPSPQSQALTPDGSMRWLEIRRAHADIAPLFWGARVSLDEASMDIRTFLSGLEPTLMTGRGFA